MKKWETKFSYYFGKAFSKSLSDYFRETRVFSQLCMQLLHIDTTFSLLRTVCLTQEM